MAQAVVATITDTARTAFATMLESGIAFTITDFVTGNKGHDQADPAIALSPNPADTTLPGQTFGPKTITSKSLISPFCVEYIADLEDIEAVGELSNLGLQATYTFDPTPAGLVGQTFLFAISNFPLRVKTDAETITFAITVQF